MLFKIKKKDYLKIGVIILVILLALVFFNFSGVPMSIIGVSDINLLEGGERILVSVVVDQQNQKFYTVPPFTKTDPESGTKLKSDTTGAVLFEPEQVTCDYKMKKEVEPLFFGLGGNIEYYIPQSSALPNIPFSVELRRGWVSSNNPESFTLIKKVSFNAYSEPTKTTSTNYGTVVISQLGGLTTGYTCPSTTFAVVSDGAGGFRVVDRASFEQNIKNYTNFCFGGNWVGCLNTLLDQSMPPSGMVECTSSGTWVFEDGSWRYKEGAGCPVGYIKPLLGDNIGNLDFVYNLSGSFAKVATVSFDKEFVGGVLVEPLILQPEVTISQGIGELKQGESTVLNAQIKNLSDESGSFYVTVFSQSSKVSVFPTVVSSLPVSANGSSSLQVNVTGLIEGSDSVCVKALSTSQFGDSKEDVECVDITVLAQEQPVACGNGICEYWLGENESSCSADCTPSEFCGNARIDPGEDCDNCERDVEAVFGTGYCDEPIVCEWWQTSITKNVPTYLIPLPFIGGLIQTGVSVEQSCVFDPMLMLLIVTIGIALIGGGLLFVLFGKKKSKSRKKRRKKR